MRAMPYFGSHSGTIERMRRLIAIGAALLALGCSGSKDKKQGDDVANALPPGHVPIDGPRARPLSLKAQAMLDSGNAAFRKKDFESALAYYHQAAESDPDHAAPWFGTYMVGQAMKNKALADSALAMVRARAPETQPHPDGAPAMPPSAPFSPHADPKAPPRTS